MKSNKMRRAEIKQQRLKRKKKSSFLIQNERPKDSVLADLTQLIHNNSYSPLPSYYIDKPFICKDCGAQQVWTALQQKWWYEVAKGHIDSTAVRCRPCRKREQARKAQARQIHLAGLQAKQHCTLNPANPH